MKTLKTLIIGIIIGLLFGFWFGVNIGRDRPILSNPFAEKTFSEAVKDTGKDIGQLMEKAGQKMQ
ncbi:MAG: hypothetical protein HN790_05670 [Methylococcales bacterium]|jgi:hypothetical protein|nr:hypothetical protein [Methylococcales bacterium]